MAESVTGLNEAIRELTEIVEAIPIGAKELPQRLGDIARDEAQARYGAWDVTVENEPFKRGKGTTVTATGNKALMSHDGEEIGSIILMAEFGAGDLADSHPWASEVPMVYPGSYSETYGTGEYAKDRVWHWQGITFVYQVPTYAMYYGSQKAEASAPSVIREVFK